MFFQLPLTDEPTLLNEATAVSKRKNKNRKRKKSKRNNIIKKEVFKGKQSQFALTMSSWAESFAVATTWHIKHQLASWKARAKALEYENRILHGMLRQNQLRGSMPSDANVSCDIKCYSEEETEEDSEGEEEKGHSEDDLEVSEEYIQFLVANSKYKEDARRERERLRAIAEEDDKQRLESEKCHVETIGEKHDRMKSLYGDRWEKISALEMSLEASLMEQFDKVNPIYWPNIPLNLN